MAQAYSVDLRVRVLADYDEGTRPVDLITKFRVSERWVYKLLKQRRDTGNIEPLESVPGPKPKLESHREDLLTMIREQPDLTLEEMKARLPIPVGIATIWRALKDLGVTLKKSPQSSRARTA